MSSKLKAARPSSAKPAKHIAAAAHPEYVGKTTIPIRDCVVALAIENDMLGSETIAELSTHLVDLAAATLRCADMRGDDDGDPPRTFSDAIKAAHFLLSFSQVLRGAAQELASTGGAA